MICFAILYTLGSKFSTLSSGKKLFSGLIWSEGLWNIKFSLKVARDLNYTFKIYEKIYSLLISIFIFLFRSRSRLFYKIWFCWRWFDFFTISDLTTCLSVAERSSSWEFATTEADLRSRLLKHKFNWLELSLEMRPVAKWLCSWHSTWAPKVVFKVWRIFNLRGKCYLQYRERFKDW